MRGGGGGGWQVRKDQSSVKPGHRSLAVFHVSVPGSFCVLKVGPDSFLCSSSHRRNLVPTDQTICQLAKQRRLRRGFGRSRVYRTQRGPAGYSVGPTWPTRRPRQHASTPDLLQITLALANPRLPNLELVDLTGNLSNLLYG